MIDQPVTIRSDEQAVAKVSRWSQLRKLIQPIAVAACAALLISAPAPEPALHAGAPQLGNRSVKKDEAEIWTDVQQWMQKNCVNQWTFYSRKLADRPGQQQHARKLMIEQYQRVMSARDSQMREALTKQATYKDNIFGIVLDYRRGQLQRPQALQQVGNWEGKLANIEIFMRQTRIVELQNEIADLQQHRSEWVSSVSARDLNQADLPPARMNPGSSMEAAPLIEDTATPPAAKSRATTRPDSH